MIQDLIRVSPVRDLHALSHALLPIVARAGAAIMRVYDDEGFTVQNKDDNSPLTLADLESQRVISQGLVDLTPGIRILS
jgi:3'(2'), 5'-bisphosphate nucleotidase